MKKDYSISFVRFMAMIFIITCHILQYYKNTLAWWFNVGVQVFLFVSGFLYANKNINSCKKFYIKEFIKILLPYYIYSTIIVLIYAVVGNGFISFASVLKAVFLVDTIKGLEHLWFIRYIIICYLILPVLLLWLKNNTSKLIELLKLFSVIILFETISLITKNFINGTWINCFILGIYISRNINNKNLFRIILCLTIVFNMIQIYIKYVSNIKLSGIYNMMFNKFSNISHLLLAITLFFLFRYIYSRILKATNINKMLNWSDKNSYFIYITHHIYILGAYSVFNYINNPILATTIVLILTLISAYILRLLTFFPKMKIIGGTYEKKAN